MKKGHIVHIELKGRTTKEPYFSTQPLLFIFNSPGKQIKPALTLPTLPPTNRSIENAFYADRQRTDRYKIVSEDKKQKFGANKEKPWKVCRKVLTKESHMARDFPYVKLKFLPLLPLLRQAFYFSILRLFCAFLPHRHCILARLKLRRIFLRRRVSVSNTTAEKTCLC